MPPRSLKSIAVSVAWVAWRLGHDPALRFVCCSYSAELALKHARDCRPSCSPTGIPRLPAHGPLQGAQRRARLPDHRPRRPVLHLGRRHPDRPRWRCIIIDDPIKPEDAASEIARKVAIEWFGSTLLSRLNDKAAGAIVLVMQRLHEDDLAGHVLEAGGWEHLCLPAIAEIDEEIPIEGGDSFSAALAICCTSGAKGERCWTP